MQKLVRLKFLTLFLSLLLATGCWFGQTLPVFAQPSSPALIASIFSFSGKRPANLGVKEGHLAECPKTPNCVSSQSADAAHNIEPLAFDAEPAEAFSKLKAVLQSQNNAKIIAEGENYLYAEFTSPIMGFVDDVEFYLDEGAKVIQVRSASRLGESDLGVNRQRIEAIRAKFNA